MSKSSNTRFRRIVTSGRSLVSRHMGLHVISAGTAISAPGSFERQKGRILQSHALVYLVAGGGAFETAASRRMKVDAGTVLFLVPGIEHRYGATADQRTWQEYWMIFEGSIPDRLVAQGVINPANPIRRPGIRQDWIQRWERVFAEWDVGGLVDEAALNGDLYTILSQALAGGAVARLDERSQLIEAMKSYLVTCTGDRAVDFEAMAESFGLSYSHARALFRDQTGMALNQYLTSLKLQQAKKLLLSTQRPVREIAEDLGYGDPYYFSRLFKKHEGTAPDHFRARYQTWIDDD